MSKKWNFLIVGSVLFFLLLVAGCSQQPVLSGKQGSGVSTLDCTVVERVKQFEFGKIAERVVKENRDKEWYWWRYAKELVKELNESGYMAFSAIVENSETDAKSYGVVHEVVFLLLPIEATTGQIYTPDIWNAYNTRLVDPIIIRTGNDKGINSSRREYEFTGGVFE